MDPVDQVPQSGKPEEFTGFVGGRHWWRGRCWVDGRGWVEPEPTNVVDEARALLADLDTPPSWCCQKCGEPIGWLGRLFRFHRCGPTTPK
jgi:hypothetical protein